MIVIPKHKPALIGVLSTDKNHSEIQWRLKCYSVTKEEGRAVNKSTEFDEVQKTSKRAKFVSVVVFVDGMKDNRV